MSKLILGDSSIMLEAFPDKCMDCVITDPPYLVGYVSRRTAITKVNRKYPGDDYQSRSVVKKVLEECKRIMKDNSAIYVFSSDMHLDFYLHIVNKLFWFKNVLVWKKNNWAAGDLQCSYGKQCEFIIYANKGKRRLNEIGGHQRHISILEYPRVPPKQRLHSQEKPVSLLTWLLMVSTDFGDTVLDPFCGSGSLGVACQNLGRQFIGIEIDKDVFDIAHSRLEIL